MQTVDYVVPSDNLLRSIPDFRYLDLVPRHAKTSSYRAKNFRQAPPISIPPKEWICGTYV